MDKYDLLEQIGEGAYGYVCKAREKATGELVAIKTFKDNSDHEASIQSRELEAAIAVSSPYVVELIESFRNHGSLHLVFEFAPGVNLQQHINAHPNGLPKDEVKRFTYELSQALRACHHAKIIHRDIKPENCLLDKNKKLKLCDFGVARVLDMPGAPLSNYVATRWYRPPELELRSNQYGFSVDVWSVGCILVEMASGYPLFPGESSIDQLHLIEQLLGPIPHVPGAKVVRKIGDTSQRPKVNTSSLQQLDRASSAGSTRSAMSAEGGTRHDTSAKLKAKYGYWLKKDGGLDFLEGTLRLVPSERFSIEDCVAHPYLRSLNPAKQNNSGLGSSFVEEELEEDIAVEDDNVGFAEESLSAGAEDDEYSDCFEEPPSPCHSPSPIHRQAVAAAAAVQASSEAVVGKGRKSPYHDARPPAIGRDGKKKGGNKGARKGQGPVQGSQRDASPARSHVSGSSMASAGSGDKSVGSKTSRETTKENHDKAMASMADKSGATKQKARRERDKAGTEPPVDFGACMKFGHVNISEDDSAAAQPKKGGKDRKGVTKDGRKKTTRK